MAKPLITVLVISAVWLCSVVAAGAGDGVHLPYTCAIRDGLPRLTSSSTQRFEIVGIRQKRIYRACLDGGEADCRSMMVHSFRVKCGAVIVPWVQIAAAIRSAKIGDSWIKDGQLNLVIKDPKAEASGKKGKQFVLPLGYAPLAELGASLDPDPTSTVLAPVNSSEEAIRPTLDNAVVVEATTASAEAIPALLEDGSIYDPWEPVIYKVEPSSAVVTRSVASEATAADSSLMALLVVLVGSSLIVTAGWLGRRHFAFSVDGGSFLSAREKLSEQSEQLLGHLHSGAATGIGGLSAKLRARWLSYKWNSLAVGKPWVWRNDTISNGAKSAEALYERADAAVQALGPASALRDTLGSELKVVRQKLDSLRGGPDDSPRTAKLASSLRSAVRDLQRIGRIAESASAGAAKSGGREEFVVPKSRAEAFEVLGLNPDASEANLKRIVDALRMGWHPDHAKDESDKALREERTKQINIAWDLIVGKRTA
ncbi:MAG: J domain-containing protein [Filomicrobium sp.]